MLWFRYVQKDVKESAKNLSSELPNKVLKLKKNQEKCIFLQSADLNFKNVPFGFYYWAT